MRINVFYKKQNEENGLRAIELAKKLGFIIDENNPDIVISIGGDGTFLRAVHHHLDKLEQILFVGVNFGTLGFYNQFGKDELEKLFQCLKEQQYQIKEFHLLKGIIDNKEEIYALNEIRMENPFHTLTNEVYLNDEFLQSFKGNGLIVCSSLGSTAYNRSLGGAIIDHSLEVLQMTEIAPIMNNYYHSLGSSLVISGDKKIIFKTAQDDVIVGYDFISEKKENFHQLEISLSTKKVRIIYQNDYSLAKLYQRSFVK